MLCKKAENTDMYSMLKRKKRINTKYTTEFFIFYYYYYYYKYTK